MIKFNEIIKQLLFCSIFIFALTAQQTSPPDRLSGLVEKLNTYQAYSLTFKQANQHMSTGMEKKAEGLLFIQKPDRFEWIYSSEPQNKIICDGYHIMMLLPDTQQAMIDKSAEHAVIWSPLAILTPSNLDTHFRVVLLDNSDFSSRYRLYPLRNDQPYEYVEVIIYEASAEKFFSLVIMDLAGSVNTLDFGALVISEEPKLIVLPPVPDNFDVTDFYGNPQNFSIF